MDGVKNTHQCRAPSSWGRDTTAALSRCPHNQRRDETATELIVPVQACGNVKVLQKYKELKNMPASKKKKIQKYSLPPCVLLGPLAVTPELCCWCVWGERVGGGELSPFSLSKMIFKKTPKIAGKKKSQYFFFFFKQQKYSLQILASCLCLPSGYLRTSSSAAARTLTLGKSPISEASERSHLEVSYPPCQNKKRKGMQEKHAAGK